MTKISDSRDVKVSWWTEFIVHLNRLSFKGVEGNPESTTSGRSRVQDCFCLSLAPSHTPNLTVQIQPGFLDAILGSCIRPREQKSTQKAKAGHTVTGKCSARVSTSTICYFIHMTPSPPGCGPISSVLFTHPSSLFFPLANNRHLSGTGGFVKTSDFTILPKS